MTVSRWWSLRANCWARMVCSYYKVPHHRTTSGWVVERKKKMKINSKYFLVTGNRLFRRGTDSILRKSVVAAEVTLILTACHDSTCGGHFSRQLIGQKILRTCYFWPTLFKYAHTYTRKCDAYQRYAKNNLRMKLPLHVSLPLILFEKWRIDYVGKTPPFFEMDGIYHGSHRVLN